MIKGILNMKALYVGNDIQDAIANIQKEYLPEDSITGDMALRILIYRGSPKFFEDQLANLKANKEK
jgi:hypothetical protein